ncbi:MAG: hypothetical protein JOZ52_03490 [Acidobacteria bacterium]|nr:hypothetical protein [Acidobacteriota bacterium]
MKHYTKIFRYALSGIALCGALAVGGASLTASAQQRDPFMKYVPPKKPKYSKLTPVQITPPSIQERVDRYKAEKLAAMNAQRPAPKPTTALLLSEMQVTGIFRTPRGYAAMVEATPIKLSYVVYPGERFYDGQLVAIEENRLVFRHEKRWSDGRNDVSTEMKPLRQPTIADSMTAQKDAKAAPVEEEKGGAPKAKAPVEKP